MAFSLTARPITATTTVATLQESQPSKIRVNSHGNVDLRNVSSVSKTAQRASDDLQKTQQNSVPTFLTAGNLSNQPAAQPGGWWNQIFQFSSDPWAEILPSNSQNSEAKSSKNSVFSTSTNFPMKATMKITESAQVNGHKKGQRNGQRKAKDDVSIFSDQFDSISSAVLKKESVKPKIEKEETDTEIRNLDWRAVRFTAQKAQSLRRTLRKTETWNDKMYHSGIAAKLAEAISGFDSLL